MSFEARRAAIERIEAMRGSHVITYVTSTRENLETQMSIDQVGVIYEHLQLIDTVPDKTTLDLFVHSNGGDGVVPWRIVALARQYCRELNLLVPNRAFSAATLLALGADNVFMHPMGNLGPIDPAVTTPFNPPDPNNPTARKLPVSVEDVAAFIALVREDVGIRHEDELVQAFLALANKEVIHPIALGSVKRSTAQGRMLAERLLGSRKTPMAEHEITEVVRTLTSELYYHGHPIDWHEARNDLGLTFVDRADDALCDAMWDLFKGYSDLLQLETAFDPNMEAVQAGGLPAVPAPPSNMPPSTGQNAMNFVVGPFTTVAIESRHQSNTFQISLDLVVRREWTGNLHGMVSIQDRGWHRAAPSPTAPQGGAADMSGAEPLNAVEPEA